MIVVLMTIIPVILKIQKSNIEKAYIARVEYELLKSDVAIDRGYLCSDAYIASCLKALLVSNELRRCHGSDLIQVPEYSGSNEFIAKCLEFNKRSIRTSNDQVCILSLAKSLDKWKFVTNLCAASAIAFLGIVVIVYIVICTVRKVRLRKVEKNEAWKSKVGNVDSDGNGVISGDSIGSTLRTEED